MTRMLKRVTKVLSRMAFQTPLEHLAAYALAISVVVGLLAIVEPASALRFRRSVHAMKVLPYLCRLKSVRSLVNKIHELGQTPSIALLTVLVGAIVRVLMFPLHIIAAGFQPEVVRSVLLLVGIPCGFLYACCKAPIKLLRKTPGTSALVAWMATALTLGATTLISPLALRWAVSDISITLYFALLATILTVSAVEERLGQSQDPPPPRGGGGGGQRVCSERSHRTALYLFAGVVALWVLRYADARRLSYTALSDVDRIMGRNYKVKAVSQDPGVATLSGPRPTPTNMGIGSTITAMGSGVRAM